MKTNDLKEPNALNNEEPKPKRLAWNYGKRKPIVDEDGLEWCNCLQPKLVAPFQFRGQASCLLCMSAWYH